MWRCFRSPPLLIIVSLALGACQPPAPTITAPVSPSTPAGPVTAAEPRPTIDAALWAAATPGRSAVLSELRNDVRACAAADQAWDEAVEGECIYAGGGVRTGAEARVRLDLSEGVIVRLAADTVFTLQSASPPAADLAARLSLAAGKVWVAVLRTLGFQQVEVETPSGLATVRGSFMSVDYAPGTGRLVVTCLEGRCQLAGASGRRTDLTDGQQAEIAAVGQDPSAPRPMDASQFADWAQNCPEAPRPAPTPTRAAPAATRTPPPTEPPPVTSILLSPGADQCGQMAVPAGEVEFSFGVGRWPTAEEAAGAIGDSLPAITLDGQPLAIGYRTGPEWHTGGEPAGWGFSTYTRVTLSPGTYVIISEWYWPDVFTCQLTVGGR